MIWDPSDANPLHRRLPAEIVSRRRGIETKKGPTLPKIDLEDILVDLKTAITVKVDARPKWLSKACKLTQDGKASATELYNIVSSRRFSAGLPERIGRKLGTIVKNNMDLFSEKQRRFLNSSEFHLNYLMVEAAPDDDGEEPEAAPDAPSTDGSARTETMMANCRAFVREQQTDEAKAAKQDGGTKDADRMTRLVEEAAKKSREKTSQKEERRNFLEAESEKFGRARAQQEEAKRKKLEEEADALFERALCPAPRARESDDRHRRSRSRSISAKRISESPPRRRAEWKRGRPDELTGSRAILLNRDFVEDLPHLPRPAQGGTRGLLEEGGDGGGGGSSSRRSRSRSRDRRRRRR